MRRLRLERPMSSPVAMPQGTTLVLQARGIGCLFIVRDSRDSPIVAWRRPCLRSQTPQYHKREGGERPLDEHVEGCNEEWIRKVCDSRMSARLHRFLHEIAHCSAPLRTSTCLLFSSDCGSATAARQARVRQTHCRRK